MRIPPASRSFSLGAGPLATSCRFRSAGWTGGGGRQGGVLGCYRLSRIEQSCSQVGPGFPVILSQTWMRSWSVCQGLMTVDVEGLFVAQDASRDPRQFVGRSRCQPVAMKPWSWVQNHAPKLKRSQLCGRIRMTFAAWMNKVLRYLRCIQRRTSHGCRAAKNTHLHRRSDNIDGPLDV